MSKWTKTSYDEGKMEEKLLRPYQYLAPLRIYGLVPSKLIKAYNYWLHIPEDKLHSIQNILVKLNNSVAIQDDILDDSLYRRTRPAAHRVFGASLAFNASAHLLCLALEDVIKLGHPKCTEVYSKGYFRYIRGTGTALYWREHQCDVSYEDFYQMTLNQTGSEVIMTLELMQVFSDNKTDYTYLAKIFSIYYQIRDEYVDLKKPEAVEEGTRMIELESLSSLNFCEDLSDGKLSFPVIHALKSRHRDVILGILRMRTRDMKVKEYLLSLLEETGGLDKTRKILRELEADIFAEIRRLGGNPLFEDLIRDLQCWE